MRSVLIKIHINYFQWLLLLCYILTSLRLIVYLIPGFQAVSIKFTQVRDTYNKQYVSPLITDIVFGLNIITIVFYIIAIVKLISMVNILYRNRKLSENGIFMYIAGGIPLHTMGSLSNWDTSSNKDTSFNGYVV